LIGGQKIIDIVQDGRIDIGRYIANFGSSCSFCCKSSNMRITKG
jgi:hypothetical protein